VEWEKEGIVRPLAHALQAHDLDVWTREEFEARLSVLCDLLRHADRRASAKPGRKDRTRRLAAIEASIAQRVQQDSRPRVSTAINVLEAIVSLRDSGQHGAASHQGVPAIRRLGLNYPVTDWTNSWQIVSARTAEALGVLRDELRATLD
jgi:hypothetical protein